MRGINTFLDSIRALVRGVMRSTARGLNKLSGGRLSPNAVTLVGLIAHVPIAWLIAQQRLVLAAVLLIIFGLFDALDGELARLQNRASAQGMLLDATTDRIKEVILYMGIAYYFVGTARPYASVGTLAALGGSLLVSYVKAKGEVAVSGGKASPNEINRLFQDGLLRFEVRMGLLVIGLLTGQISIFIIIITVLAWFTVFERLIKIGKHLR